MLGAIERAGAVSRTSTDARAGSRRRRGRGRPARQASAVVALSVAVASASAVAKEPERPGSLAEHYCQAVRDATGEARHAYQAAQLAALERSLEERIGRIDTRIAELKALLARQEEIAGRATAQLVDIYRDMRAEAASDQLAHMDEATAAAILGKLASRAASAILSDMPGEKAARLTSIMAGPARRDSRPGEGR